MCAPSKTERPPADRVKTDKRDAIRLARLLAAGELTLVTVPSLEREQLRDLVRCREDIRVDLMRARNRIGKFLLRREIYWEGRGETWSRKHRSWLTSVRFADPASRATLADYLHAHDVLIARRDQVEADLAQLAVSAPCAHTVARLRCLRGIDTLTALGLCAEIGEWERFDHPDQLASYLGIVPTTHHGHPATRSITKAGSTHARRRLSSAGATATSRPPATTTRAHIGTSTPAGASSKTPRRDRRGRDRPRARRLLLADRHLHPSSRSGSADIPAGGATPSRTQPRSHTSTHQPPARGSPTHAKPHRHPVAAGEAARASPARHELDRRHTAHAGPRQEQLTHRESPNGDEAGATLVGVSPRTLPPMPIQRLDICGSPIASPIRPY